MRRSYEAPLLAGNSALRALWGNAKKRRMIEVGPAEPARGKLTYIAYGVVFGVFILTAWLHLATAFLAALFGYLALRKLHFVRGVRGKWLAVVLFVLLVSGIAYGLGFLVKQTVQSLPRIAEESIPPIINWARQHQIELPFTDYDSLKEAAFDTVKNEVSYLNGAARFARGAGTQFLLLVVGGVVALGVFLNPGFESDRPARSPALNLYSACCDELSERFGLLYRSFSTVMGAQLSISAINTGLTAVFVTALHLPYAVVVVGLTFLCGLVPVVGNLVSNTIIVGIGFSVSPRMALTALVFLVAIHKLEYLLNSQIVGQRIRNPLWLTLLALVLGERLMGVAGMILAPVVLHYLRLELSAYPVAGCIDAGTAGG